MQQIGVILIASNIGLILVLSGAATAGIVAMFVAPRPVLRLVFGVDEVDVLTIFLARYVGLLVFLFGCLIVYCAFNHAIRAPVLAAASVEKLIFASFVTIGQVKRTPLLTAAAIADTLFALLYILYLAGI